MITRLERIDVNGIELEYEVAGSGSPVVLIHGSHVADGYLPLMREPELRERFQLIRYHRRGLAGSSPVKGPVSIAQQAADCAGLLQALGVGPAHVAGQSYGGVIALQLAVDQPALVRSLALMEPAMLFLVPSAQTFLDGAAPVIEAYQRGDKAGAVRGFLESVAGPEAEAILEARVPGGWAQAVDDADTFFQVEMPALGEWNLSPELAARIKVPVLYVLGERTWPIFGEVRDLVHRLLPQSQDVLIPGVTHFLQAEDPAAVAAPLARFFLAS
jgi:pimeloyl-ACP methyl ester carboxylesterase